MTQPLSLLIAEREALFRRGLVACLERDRRLAIAASVGTARAVQQAAATLRPAIAVIGITLPDQPGFGPITEVARRLPALKIIALADSASGDVVLTALHAGATTLISKDVSEEHLLHIVGRLADEHHPVTARASWRPTAATRRAEPVRDRSITSGGYAPGGLPLTCREHEILHEISNGMTNAEIGMALGISSQTVKNHVTAILRKLSVSDRTQAVVLAMRRGWLSINDAGGPVGTIEPRAPAVAPTWRMTPRR